MRTRLVEQGRRRGASQDQSWRPRSQYLGRVVQELHLLGTARVLAMHPLRSLLIDHLLYVLSVRSRCSRIRPVRGRPAGRHASLRALEEADIHIERCCFFHIVQIQMDYN